MRDEQDVSPEPGTRADFHSNKQKGACIPRSTAQNQVLCAFSQGALNKPVLLSVKAPMSDQRSNPQKSVVVSHGVAGITLKRIGEGIHIGFWVSAKSPPNINDDS